MVDAVQTLGELLSWGATELRGAGFAEPRREAMSLWTGVTRSTASAATLGAAEPVGGERASRFVDAARRRIAGEPVAYITGWTGFRRLTLQCDRRALIPRPETEGLVDAVLARVRNGVAADIGTGTGALALALSHEGAFDQVIGTDVSADALALARDNGGATGLPVVWLEGDLVAPLAGRQVDVLVSNPPYLTQREYDTLDRSVRDYEPAVALVGGDDGQRVVTRLLQLARRVVRLGGWIALEVDCRRADDTGRIASAAGWENVSVFDDLFGRARYVLAQQGSPS
jgi:release factor glutamine methyltransferase